MKASVFPIFIISAIYATGFFRNRVLCFLGSISYEIYLVQGALTWNYAFLSESSILYSYTVISMSIMLAYMLHVLCRYIYKYCKIWLHTTNHIPIYISHNLAISKMHFIARIMHNSLLWDIRFVLLTRFILQRKPSLYNSPYHHFPSLPITDIYIHSRSSGALWAYCYAWDSIPSLYGWSGVYAGIRHSDAR